MIFIPKDLGSNALIYIISFIISITKIFAPSYINALIYLSCYLRTIPLIIQIWYSLILHPINYYFQICNLYQGKDFG